MLNPRRSRGFTLIELMLVVAIIGVLASIAIPRFVNLIDKARESSLKGTLGSLRAALNIYYADNEGIYPNYDLLALQTEGVRALNGKYINLFALRFPMPRYLNAVGGMVYSGDWVYGIAGLNHQRLSTLATVDLQGAPPTQLPQYVVWKPAPLRPAYVAGFRYGGGSTPTDLSGKPWSSW